MVKLVALPVTGPLNGPLVYAAGAMRRMPSAPTSGRGRRRLRKGRGGQRFGPPADVRGGGWRIGWGRGLAEAPRQKVTATFAPWPPLRQK
jgi:hypothetical protein